jgi:ribosomal protein L37AE/L43A
MQGIVAVYTSGSIGSSDEGEGRLMRGIWYCATCEINVSDPVLAAPSGYNA